MGDNREQQLFGLDRGAGHTLGLVESIMVLMGQEEKLPEADEKDFQRQFKARARKLKRNPNPDDPLHFFNARKAFMQLKSEGLRLEDQDHLGSVGLKKVGHPTQFGYDTPDGTTLINRITDTPATVHDLEASRKARNVFRLPPIDMKKLILDSMLERNAQRERGGLQ